MIHRVDSSAVVIFVWRRSCEICAIALVLMAVTCARAADAVTVVEISGASTTGKLTEWATDKLVVTDKTDHRIDRRQVRSLTFNHEKRRLSGSESLIWLANGDQIAARADTVAEDIVSASWPIVGKTTFTKIPLEYVAAIILDLPPTESDRLRLYADLRTLPPGNDLVMLANGDRSQGEFIRLDAALLELKAAGQILKLDRQRVHAIRMNPQLLNSGKKTSRRTVVTLIDHSQITASEIELSGDLLKLKSRELGTLSIPQSAVVACQFFGERLVPVADYEPAKIEFTPYFSNHWPLVRNANVLHGPLSLRGTEYTHGLGVHSQIAITYELRGNEQEFRGVVGIDDVAAGSGSVVFAVDLDGRRVWTSEETTGTSPAITVPALKLAGGKRVTLRVQFGQLADVSDYADWCDAVFITD